MIRIVSVVSFSFALILTACSTKPKPVEKKEPLAIAPPSKPMRSRAPKPLTAAQEAEIARAAANAKGEGAGSGGGAGVAGGAGGGTGGSPGVSGGQAGGAASSIASSVSSDSSSVEGASAREKLNNAWGGADGVDGAQGIVYPVAPEVSGVSSDMINALKLADTDPRRKFIGIWEQSGGTADADFGHGGYRQTVLVFRTDGVLDVIRFYGENSETRVDSRLMYAVAVDNALTISQDPKLSGVSRASDLRLPGIDGKNGIIAAAPKLKLPAKLSPSINAEEMTLDGKVYRRRKQPGG
jgi:hypothetical protein